MTARRWTCLAAAVALLTCGLLLATGNTNPGPLLAVAGVAVTALLVTAPTQAGAGQRRSAGSAP